MSEILTLKRGTKRSFDAMDLDNPPVPCQQRRITFLSSASVVKKSRTAVDIELLKKARVESCTRVLPTSSSQEQRDVVDRHISRRRSRTNGKEKLFSLDDVKELVRRVLAEREAQLQNQFRLHMSDTLAEQAEQFSKFGDAYVARQFRKNCDVSYVS